MTNLTSLGAMATAQADNDMMTTAGIGMQLDAANNSMKVAAADSVGKQATSIGNKVSQVSGASH